MRLDAIRILLGPHWGQRLRHDHHPRQRVEPRPPVHVLYGISGVVYDASGFQTATLFAFSANGTTGCAGSPLTCSPLWSAPLAAPGGIPYDGSNTLAVYNGTVYVDAGPGLEAFDANGKVKCSGTPTICAPMWQASVNWSGGTPTVSNGTVFVSSNGVLEAFDANGTVNCSGSPTTCSPIWTSDISDASAPVTVSGGFAYVETGSGLSDTVTAFDASGNTGCSGTPKVCTPLWTYALKYSASNAEPYVSVSGSTLYAGTAQVVSARDIEGDVEAFDASGVSGCNGTPKVCSPLWTSVSPFPSGGPPIVGDGVAFYMPYVDTAQPFAALDAAGSKNCSGVPVVCGPLWTSSIDASPIAIGGSVLYATNEENIFAFDATGTDGCTASVCTPLWSTGRPNGSVAIEARSWPTECSTCRQTTRRQVSERCSSTGCRNRAGTPGAPVRRLGGTARAQRWQSNLWRSVASPAAANLTLTVSLVSAEKFSVAVSASATFCGDCGHPSARHHAESGGEHRCNDCERTGEVRLWNGPAVAMVAAVLALVVVGGALVH